MSDTKASVDLVALLELLQAQEAHYSQQLTAVREEIGSVKHVLAIAQRHTLSGSGTPDDATGSGPGLRFRAAGGASGAGVASTARVSELVPHVRGLTQVEALKRIAQHNNGVVRTVEAKPIFLQAGLTKGNPKHIGTHIYHLLDGSPEYEKVAPGTFRWLPYAAPGETRPHADHTDRSQAPQLRMLIEQRQEADKELAAGNPEGPHGEGQELPLPERNGYGRVGMVPVG